MPHICVKQLETSKQIHEHKKIPMRMPDGI